METICQEEANTQTGQMLEGHDCYFHKDMLLTQK